MVACRGTRGGGRQSSCGMEVHPCTGVQGTVGGRGWSKGEGGRARGAVREASEERSRRGDSEGRRGRQGAPVTTRYGSLSDRCRYRVAVSPESVGRSPLRHFSLARSLARSLALAGPAGVDSPLPPARGCVPARLVVGSSARSPARTFTRSLHYLRSGVRDDSRATGLKGSIDRAKHGGLVGSRYPESVATWRSGSRRGYMGV